MSTLIKLTELNLACITCIIHEHLNLKELNLACITQIYDDVIDPVLKTKCNVNITLTSYTHSFLRCVVKYQFY